MYARASVLSNRSRSRVCFHIRRNLGQQCLRYTDGLVQRHDGPVQLCFRDDQRRRDAEGRGVIEAVKHDDTALQRFCCYEQHEVGIRKLHAQQQPLASDLPDNP